MEISGAGILPLLTINKSPNVEIITSVAVRSGETTRGLKGAYLPKRQLKKKTSVVRCRVRWSLYFAKGGLFSDNPSSVSVPAVLSTCFSGVVVGGMFSTEIRGGA